jgi:hypothetical protein
MQNTLSTHDIEVMSADELESVSGGGSATISEDYFPYGIIVRESFRSGLQANDLERLRLKLKGEGQGVPRDFAQQGAIVFGG